MDMMEDFLRMKKWAVVGATDNEDKFGYKIYKCMKDAGYEVYPVNPGVAVIDGDKCYPSVNDLPEKPEAVDLVVPEKVGEQVIRELAAEGISHVWLQPGANAESVVKLAKELGLEVIDDGCVMKEIRVRGISHK